MNKSRYLMASSLGAALTIVAILIFIFVTLPDSGVTTSPVDKEDDYYLRGSINETSEGKKVTSNTKEYVCGASTSSPSIGVVVGVGTKIPLVIS